MKLKFVLGLSIGLIIGLSTHLSIVQANLIDEENRSIVTTLPQIIEAIDLDKTFTFAGEDMPNNFDNKERLDRELLVNAYWQSATLMHIKAANRYFPTIERILAENGIPDDFKY